MKVERLKVDEEIKIKDPMLNDMYYLHKVSMGGALCLEMTRYIGGLANQES